MRSSSASMAKSLANIDDFIKGLEKRNPTDVETNSVQAVLYEWAFMFIKDCRERLEQSGNISSGDLSQNISPSVEGSNGVYTLSITLPDYYDFVNKGVQGVNGGNPSQYKFKTLKVSYSMMKSIRGWMKRNNLKATVQNKSFKHKSVRTFESLEKSAAFAIATGIKKKGIKGSHYFDNALDAQYPKLAPMLAKALSEDVVFVIKNLNVIK